MVLPLRDDNSDVTSWPVVNIVIIVINVLVFVLLQGMGENQGFTYAFSTVPAEILSGKDIAEHPVTPEAPPDSPDEPPGLRPTPIPVYLTILTSMFMHGSVMHILGNMWFLWIFGDNIEDDFGKPRYVVFYLLCGVIASLAHVFTNMSPPNSLIPSLGASGAISGVMGAYLVLHAKRRVTVLLLRVIMDVPGYVAVGLWFGFQIVSSLSTLGGQGDGVAYAAHIGGFIAGAALAPLFMLGRPKKNSAVAPSYGYRERA